MPSKNWSVRVGDVLGFRVGVVDGRPVVGEVGECEGFRVRGDRVGSLVVGCVVGWEIEGDEDGVLVGFGVIAITSTGDEDGSFVGDDDGATEASVGRVVGDDDSRFVGDDEGAREASVGGLVGLEVGRSACNITRSNSLFPPRKV
jgi:hypothetical protein